MLPAPVRVKICGLRDQAGIEAAVEAGADWLGLVFFPRSPRCVSIAEAASLCRSVPEATGLVGLLVSPTDDDIARVLEAVPLRALQLYAPAQRIDEIRARVEVAVWHAIGAGTAADLPIASRADALVIESRPSAGSDRPGGNGVRFDWRILKGWAAPKPWLLAGGLDPDNVAEAIATSGADAVDVSSGVETAPGIKDPMLIRRFVQAARRGGPR